MLPNLIFDSPDIVFEIYGEMLVFGPCLVVAIIIAKNKSDIIASTIVSGLTRLIVRKYDMEAMKMNQINSFSITATRRCLI